MSDRDQDGVGYGRPPREHQFSKQNQPRRRRSKATKALGHDILTHVLDALGEDVPVTVNGKRTKAKMGRVFANQLVKGSVSGTFGQKLKFAKFLETYREFDPERIKEALEQEYNDALAEEQNRSTELVVVLKEYMALTEDLQKTIYIIAAAFRGAMSKCSCIAFDDYSEAAEVIAEWSQDEGPDEPDSKAALPPVAHGTGWARSGPNGLGSPPPDGYEDDLSAGMIGSD